MALPGPEYLALAYRLPYYAGVVAARAQEEADGRRKRLRGGREVEGTREAIQANPDLAAVISFG